MSDNKEKTFTEAMRNLQNAAQEIGRQATSLEESLKLFESGMKEAEFCKDILDKAEQRITVYQEKGEDENAQL